jgi:hypothetical protein
LLDGFGSGFEGNLLLPLVNQQAVGKEEEGSAAEDSEASALQNGFTLQRIKTCPTTNKLLTSLQHLL